MSILPNDESRSIGSLVAAFTLLGSPLCVHADDAEILDIAARIDYGYYAGEARVVAGARADLERLRMPAGAKSYYLGYSAYRLSQLESDSDQRSARELRSACIDSARASLDDPTWVLEGWILLAACSLEARQRETARVLVHDLRLKDALAEARQRAAHHPRLLLIEAWAERGVDADAMQARLTEARERFESWSSRGIQPIWGMAETLASLGEVYLDSGDRRQARDLIEQALIEAPGYHVALALQNRLSLPPR